MNYPPAVYKLPLSSLENMTLELEWRFEDLMNQLEEIRDELKQIKAAVDDSELHSTFDPLQTIGKY
jgi:hypothetical protein